MHREVDTFDVRQVTSPIIEFIPRRKLLNVMSVAKP